MNNKIRSVKLSHVIFMDIETASQHPKLEPKSELFRIFQWKHRNKEDCSLLPTPELQKIYKNTAALSPIYGKIVCITFGRVGEKGDIVVVSYSGEEKEILTKARVVLEKLGFTFVGFNLPNFDNNFLRKRSNILGITYPEQINDSGKKPWGLEERLIDLMQDFKGSGYNNDSLEELCYAFGVESPKKGDVKGNEVSKVFHEGGIDKIVAYCEDDVRATAKLFLKMREV